MEKVHYLENSPAIGRLGFGAWQLGNIESWGPMSTKDAIELVQEAVRLGINFFDTAPGYGNGESERLLGEALVGLRSRVVINSKFGHHANGTTDFRVEVIQKSIHESLKRLKTTYLDSIVLHNPSRDILLNHQGHFDYLEQLRQTGLIHGYGVSIDTPEEVSAVLTHGKVQVIELLYNVFFQATREQLQAIADRHIAIIIKVPLDSGWLTGKYDEKASFSGIRSRWTSLDIQRRAGLVDQLRKLVPGHDLTPYALGFLLSYPQITAIIPGVRSITQLQSLVSAAEIPFSSQLKQQFEHFYDQYIRETPLPW